MKFRITKNRYLEGFGIVVVILALVRCFFPSVAERKVSVQDGMSVDSTQLEQQHVTADVSDKKELSVTPAADEADRKEPTAKPLEIKPSRFFDSAGNIIKNKILSVSNYKEAFPDSNDLQLLAAQKYGVSPVEYRADAENNKSGLVYIGANPYYDTDPMTRSIPYLVPRAATLLNDIGRAFFDSLQVKGLPINRFIVTSATRTREDVAILRRHNRNATENSCHMYGTTFDISYTRYNPISTPVSDDQLKWVLSEVLRDMRESERCYVKYEVKQSCFHVTTR